ncbi:hypothetical protein [Corynebacterium auris]|uniref:hypothetical protein n=1 Tax=Corynebacterium auris TaxID=44750 RepID=UPI0025B524AA|nr:hypothetical protein [Corynebacterium auris]
MKRTGGVVLRAAILALPPAMLVVAAVLQVGAVHRVLLWAVAGYALACAVLGVMESLLRLRST